jgi:hypothetical protein
MFYERQTPKRDSHDQKPERCLMACLQALLVSERQITVADEEKLNLKTDDANFPWGIGGTDSVARNSR